jgi:histidinol-phosphate phosphatase family protein
MVALLAHHRLSEKRLGSGSPVMAPRRPAENGRRPVDAVLFDRDGTLVVDVPYNGDPTRVRPVAGAPEVLRRLRAAGVAVGVVSNQSGVARGLFTEADLARVHARVEELLGPFEAVEYCPHGEGDGCRCRKPRPGMVRAAAARLGIDPARCLVVGDTAADVAAAEAAGARGVLVPNEVTRPEEVAEATHVAADLAEAVDRYVLGPRPAGDGGDRPVLIARLDNAGDVLLAGPAVRAVAHRHPVLLAVGPHGRGAADILPGVADVLELAAPWVLADPPPVDTATLDRFVGQVAERRPRAAAVLTSSHQSALPLALLLRAAGVPEIAAVSLDYPGSLLDHRIPGDPDVHEVERALAVVGRLGYHLPPGDDRLAVDLPTGPAVVRRLPPGPYVVVHPGASAPARTLAPDRWAEVAEALAGSGRRVVVTGSAAEAPLTAAVAAAAPGGVDLGGACSLAGLAAILAGADAVACGNTGPMHLAAAVGTPVAAVFPPTVPLERWRPWRVPHVVLGDQGIGCRGCRSRQCPVPGHPCVAAVDGAAVRAAIDHLTSEAAAADGRPAPTPTLEPEGV